MTFRSLGDVCPPCYLNSGSDCEICPDGVDSADFPECADCVNGVKQTLTNTAAKSLLVPVVAGVLTTLIGAWLASRLFQQKH